MGLGDGSAFAGAMADRGRGDGATVGRSIARTLRMSHEGKRPADTRIQDQSERAAPHWLNTLGSPSLVVMMSAASSGGRGALAEYVVVSGLGGIPSNICNGYRKANRPGKKDEEVGVSQ